MNKTLVLAFLMAGSAAVATPRDIVSGPSLGLAEGRCRPGESGPAFLVNITGLKDRQGTLKVELYPATDADFLADDDKLLEAGKTFRRAVIDVPSSGPVQMCIRAPSAGAWALSFLHDRDGNRKFGLSVDGIGFPSNPSSLGPSRPGLSLGRAVVGNGPTQITVRMLYRRGLFSFGPIR